MTTIEKHRMLPYRLLSIDNCTYKLANAIEDVDPHYIRTRDMIVDCNPV